MKNIIKCVTSLVIGLYVGFVLTLSITGYIMSKEFISKKLFRNGTMYIDGKFYVIKEK